MAKIPLSAQASTRLRSVSTANWTVEMRTSSTCTGGAVIKDDDDDDGGSNRDGLVLSLMKPLNCAQQWKEQQIYFIKLMMMTIVTLHYN